MKLATIRRDGQELAALVDNVRGVAAIVDIAPDLAGMDVMAILGDPLHQLSDLAQRAGDHVFTTISDAVFTAPYRRPRKIWGIGLNYADHAKDLSEEAPSQPASFIKGDHTIIGQDEAIIIPHQSKRMTVEGELGLIIGRTCRNVSADDALDYVWGVTTILDQTAEDILRENPRFLTRSKNFPTFFCFGPELIPLAEVLKAFGSLDEVEVSTVVNGDDHRTNVVGNMTHGPADLVSFHSQMMPLFPGDIISTGTPGAIVVKDGDTAECVIPGIGTLRTTVVDQASPTRQSLTSSKKV